MHKRISDDYSKTRVHWSAGDIGGLIVALSICSLGLMLLYFTDSGFAGVVILFPLTFLVFAGELLMFRALFLALGIDRPGPALALGHLTFICLFTISMQVGADFDPLYLALWFVPAVIDFPATGLLYAIGHSPFGVARASSPVWLQWLWEVWVPGLVYAVIGSAQYYLIGRYVIVSFTRRSAAAKTTGQPQNND